MDIIELKNWLLTTDMFKVEKLLLIAWQSLHNNESNIGLVSLFNPVKPLAQAALLDNHNTPNTTVIKKS